MGRPAPAAMTSTEAEVAARSGAAGPYRGGSGFVSLRSAVPAWRVMSRGARGRRGLGVPWPRAGRKDGMV